MWPEADLVPNVGEFVERYGSLSGDNVSYVQDNHDALFRATSQLGISSAVAEFMEKYGNEEPLEVTIPLLLRVLQRCLVVLGRHGVHGKKLNAVLTRFFECEMACVDPELGYLVHNNDEPYKSYGIVVDPPDITTTITKEALKALNELLLEDSKKLLDYVDEP